MPVNWRTEIAVWNPPHQFADTQLNGPYNYWYHTHYFKSVPGGTLMIDEVQCKLPLSAVGRLIAGRFVDSDVQQIFAFRRQVIAAMRFNL